MSKIRHLVSALFVLTLAIQAHAQSKSIGTISIEQAWARATPLGAKTGVVYLTLANNGTATDKLNGASTPVADKVEFHSGGIKNGVMRMGYLSIIELGPGEKVALKPGGSHAMLINLKERLVEGQSFPLVLEFERAGKITAVVHVAGMGALEAD